jgi:hypothetical protein
MTPLIAYNFRPAQPECPWCRYLLVLEMTENGFVGDVNHTIDRQMLQHENPNIRSYRFHCPDCWEVITLTLNKAGEPWIASLSK